MSKYESKDGFDLNVSGLSPNVAELVLVVDFLLVSLVCFLLPVENKRGQWGVKVHKVVLTL